MSSKSALEGAGRRRPWPLAARLTAWYAAWSFALVLVATGFLYWALAASLDGEDDEELADKVRVLRAALRDRPGDLSAVRSQAEWGWAARQHAPLHVRLLDAAGGAVLETPGMDRLLPAGLFPAALPGKADVTGRGADVRAPGGRPFRVLAARGEFRKVVVETESAQVYFFDAEDSEVERVVFVRERGKWKVWLAVPNPLKLN